MLSLVFKKKTHTHLDSISQSQRNDLLVVKLLSSYFARNVERTFVYIHMAFPSSSASIDGHSGLVYIHIELTARLLIHINTGDRPDKAVASLRFAFIEAVIQFFFLFPGLYCLCASSLFRRILFIWLLGIEMLGVWRRSSNISIVIVKSYTGGDYDTESYLKILPESISKPSISFTLYLL